MSLFNKALVFTDIHFGAKNNNRIHNNDCEDFVKWFCAKGKELGAETCIMMGDWHHNRHTINVSTLNYTVSNLQFLSDAFEKVYILPGNHDLIYRDKREIHSLPMGDKFPNVIVANEPLISGDVAIVPWLVEDDWKKVPKIKSRYMFGHFEIPGFKMNAMIEMPDQHQLNAKHFVHQEYVFSGHFHKRQKHKNIHYIGNPFGHNYADTWDFERGAMFLEWGKEPVYLNWTDGPRYVSTTLSELVEEPDRFLLPKASLKVMVDLELSYEEVNFLKETFTDQYQIRELKLIAQKSTEHETDSMADLKFETVDQIVNDQIQHIESDSFDKSLLIQIYNSL
jgi:DNA repair exonuclease SbcCD nuclease subunit